MSTPLMEVHLLTEVHIGSEAILCARTRKSSLPAKEFLKTSPDQRLQHQVNRKKLQKLLPDRGRYRHGRLANPRGLPNHGMESQGERAFGWVVKRALQDGSLWLVLFPHFLDNLVMCKMAWGPWQKTSLKRKLRTLRTVPSEDDSSLKSLVSRISICQSQVVRSFQWMTVKCWLTTLDERASFALTLDNG